MRSVTRSRIAQLLPLSLMVVLRVVPGARAQEAGGTEAELDAVGTALAYSGELPDGGSATVLLATADAFADALASGLLQGQLDAPLLLTPGAALDERVREELGRLGAERVVILGGPDALSEQVEEEVAGVVDTVDRVFGDTRVATAMAVADLAYPEGPIDSIILARAYGASGDSGSDAFADAMGAGAAAATRGYPVLLTPTDELDPELARWMEEREVRRILIAGGPAAISADIEVQLSTPGRIVFRQAGPTRVGTALAIAWVTAASGTATVVQGEGPGAWASGLAAAHSSPGGVLLVSGSTVSPDTLNSIFASGPDGVRCGVLLAADVCRLILASAAVETIDLPPPTAVMDADQMVPPSGAIASGKASVWPTGEDDLCVQIEVFEISGMSRTVEIIAAGFGQEGVPVVSVDLPTSEFGPSFAMDCTLDVDPAVRQRLFDNPEQHAVVVTTDAHPAGEFRGQVFADPDIAGVNGFLKPDYIVPGLGAAGGHGALFVVPTGVPDELCYSMDITSLDPPATAAHIHRGRSGTVGDVVFTLDAGTGIGWTAHCHRGVDADQLAHLLEEPLAFYVDIHNDAHPDGALRSQMVVDHASSDPH